LRKQIPIIMQVKYRGGKRLLYFKKNTQNDFNCLTTLCGNSTINVMNANAIMVVEDEDNSNRNENKIQEWEKAIVF